MLLWKVRCILIHRSNWSIYFSREEERYFAACTSSAMIGTSSVFDSFIVCYNTDSSCFSPISKFNPKRRSSLWVTLLVCSLECCLSVNGNACDCLYRSRVQEEACYKQIHLIVVSVTVLMDSCLYYFVPFQDCKNGLYLLSVLIYLPLVFFFFFWTRQSHF